MMGWLSNIAPTLVVTVGVIAISAAAGLITGRYWRPIKEAQQEFELLEAFLELSGDEPGAAVQASRAADQANIQNPLPVLERLLSKRYIAPVPDYLDNFEITNEGQQVAQGRWGERGR